jgi:HD superfamily phosphohydrolase
MTSLRTQRLRDPVHGLIVFRDDQPVDQLAWALIATPEFQRLRRIRQLGVADFVFPSATHTRFAHSIGVFHTARTLISIIRREVGEDAFNTKRAEVAVISALLHDLGHGPFSIRSRVCRSRATLGESMSTGRLILSATRVVGFGRCLRGTA